MTAGSLDGRRAGRQRYPGRHLLPVLAYLAAALLLASCSAMALGGAPGGTSVSAAYGSVWRHRQSEMVPVAVDKPLPIQTGDRVEVDTIGRGLLRFDERVQVELLRNTQAVVDQIAVESSGQLSVQLTQTFGEMLVQMQPPTQARLTVVTEDATIRPKERASLICHSKLLTCVVQLNGNAEVEAHGRVVSVSGGEATIIRPGQPPGTPICADATTVRQWLDKRRGTDDVQSLEALVTGLPQAPCSALAEGSPTTEPKTSAATPAVEPPSAATSTSAPASAVTLPPSDKMVRVKGGTYTVGNARVDANHAPQTLVEVQNFWIDQYEVTNSAYKAFLDATHNPPPPSWAGGNFQAGQDDHPAEGVAWDAAGAYCGWVKKRLPNEVEWEVAARGPGSNPPLYPWGADSQAGGQVDQMPETATYAAGSMPFNKSPFGVYDMAGNVWEWVAEPYYGPVQPGQKILRGGRYGLLRDMAYRLAGNPADENFYRTAGFRCAADHVAGE